MTIALPKLVVENIGNFTGRTWLLSKIIEWWDQSNERLFLLTGAPGSGKSMVLAWLAGFGPPAQDPTEAARLTRIRTVVKAAHFCEASSRNVTPSAFAENIANQLTSNLPGFAAAFAAAVSGRVQITATQTIGTIAAGGTVTGVSIGRIDLSSLGDEVGFDRAFIDPLKKLYSNGYSEPILLLVDALDESQMYSDQASLPDLLSRLDDLPVPIRIFATMRDEPRILKFFRNSRTVDLIRDSDSNIDDVELYAEGRLTKVAALHGNKQKEFARRLSMHADGFFCTPQWCWMNC